MIVVIYRQFHPFLLFYAYFFLSLLSFIHLLVWVMPTLTLTTTRNTVMFLCSAFSSLPPLTCCLSPPHGASTELGVSSCFGVVHDVCIHFRFYSNECWCQCTVYTVYTVYSPGVQCTMYTVYSASVQSTQCTVLVYSVHNILFKPPISLVHVTSSKQSSIYS